MTRRSIDDVLQEHTGEARPSAKTARKASAEIRGRADRLGKAAVSDQLMADATRLDEYASGLDLDKTARELGVGESNSPVQLGDPKDKPKGKSQGARPARRAAGKGRAPKRRGKVGSAVRQATVGEPEAAVADAVRSGGSIFWTFALGTVVLVLLYNLVANAERAVPLIDALGKGAERVAYPKTAFPERYPDKPVQGPPAPRRQSAASQPGRLVPVTNPRTANARSTRT